MQEMPFKDGTFGFATDGTPVDCVRLAKLGLVEGFDADIVVSGINHGSNLGDDITYSGTVAAALEGLVLGIPGIAVSQQSNAREMDFRLGSRFAFERAADFVARVVAQLDEVPLPQGTLLNINVPAGEPQGVQVTRLGKRIYRDELKLDAEDEDGGRRYWIYGADPGFHDEPGTELTEHGRRYYVLDDPVITDDQYDHLLDELRAIEGEHPELLTPDSPTQRIGGEPVSALTKVTHRQPMLSLANARSEEELRAWIERMRNHLAREGIEDPEFQYVAEPKIDGLAISLLYRDGVLERGATRGNGVIGEDVTHNLRTIPTIPLRVDDAPPLVEV